MTMKNINFDNSVRWFYNVNCSQMEHITGELPQTSQKKQNDLEDMVLRMKKTFIKTEFKQDKKLILILNTTFLGFRMEYKK